MKKGLLIIDVQNDFCTGSLAVPRALEIFPIIAQYFAHKNTDHAIFGVEKIVATADWHPLGHSSFSIWPPHCVADTFGAQLHSLLPLNKIDYILHKGTQVHQDSYSAFIENDQKTHTGLLEKIQPWGIDQWVLVGLATDFCVQATALDAVRLGLKVQIDARACRPVHANPVALEALYNQLRAAGVGLIFD